LFSDDRIADPVLAPMLSLMNPTYSRKK